MRQKMLALAVLCLLLSSCAEIKLDHVYDEQSGVTYTDVKSALDLAGGPRQDVLIATDRAGRVRGVWSAADPGTFQTATDRAVGDGLLALGTFGAAAVLRPSVTNTTTNTQTTGGYIAPGAISATASPTTTANSRGGNAAGGSATGGNATGGAGGNASAAGGVGVGGAATATGGRAAAVATQTQGQTQGQRQGQGQNQSQGQWNCIKSPPCN